jgi:hypothetical protein
MRFRRTAILFAAIVALSSAPSVVGAAGDLGKLLDQLASDPVEKATLFALERQPDDGRVIPALHSAFSRAKSKNEKQWIASTLLRLGDSTREYSDFLIGAAKEAIEDQTPTFIDYDQDGHSVKGRFSAKFEAWCQANGKDPRSVGALQFGTYPEDVLVLARAQDPRARETLRQGLQSPNPLVVGYAVQGLGRLGDTSAISLISKTAEALPPDARSAISMNLPWYSSLDATLLMERLTPDISARTFMVRMVQAEQLLDRQSALSRRSDGPKQ